MSTNIRFKHQFQIIDFDYLAEDILGIDMESIERPERDDESGSYGYGYAYSYDRRNTVKMPMDDLYWNSIDFGSEESLHEPSLKHYVDPWDLENYAYIREHLDSIDLDSDPSSSNDFATEATSSSFRYAPVEQNYAAIEEVRGYEKPSSRSRNRHVSVDAGLYRDGFDSEFDENPYEVNMKDVSLLPYEHKDRWRKVPMASPGRQSSRDRSFSFSYGDYGTGQEIYSRLDEVYPRRDSTLPIYDDVRSSRRKPRNFGLSNYGHLKIDYSYSWNKLDQYICH
ncbi:uncharacterized protein BDFB_004140 [Asbolus verrucosus]|uniref:Uncharacterized protein n=1 Tax=Asbolus verrucosus TaxID=1661398 RepID=A0A482W422_ASBVE|nr:uncharacterized protein BDFB_004140 [Asbolus verrucosus]